MNIEILREVQDWLRTGVDEKFNRKFNMKDWFDGGHVKTHKNWCGTTCCIAGFIVSNNYEADPFAKSYKIYANPAVNLDGEFMYPDDISIKILEANDHEAEGLSNLFCPPCGPNNINWEEITPDMAIQAIENLINDGDPKWTEIEGFMKNE